MAISLDDLDPIPTGKRLSLDTLDPIKKAPKPAPRRSLDVATESLIGVDRVTAAERDAEYEQTLTPEKLGVKRGADRIADAQTDEAFDAVRAKQIASEPKYQSFGKALLAGIDDTQKLVGAGVEATAEVLGGRSGRYSDEQGIADAFAEYGKGAREQNTAEADQYGPRGKFADISSVGDAFAWATQTAGNMIPVMVPAMVGGAAGAALAPAAGVTATVGGIVGAFVPSLVVSTGEVQANAKDKDPTKTANGWTFAGGTAIAALDSVLPGRIGGKLVEKFGREAAEEIALRALLRPAGAKLGAEMAKGALKEGGKSAAIEGLTESVQEAIGEVTASLASESKIDWKGLPANMLESGAAGALMGGGTGAPSGAIVAAKDVADANQANAGYQSGVNQEAAGLGLPADTRTNPADFASFVDARNKSLGVDPKADVPLTEADRASPLPDALIQRGKNVAADALGQTRPPRVAAKPLPTVSAPLDRMVQIVLGLEGGGTLANPKTSPKGAQGPMQVMPGTNSDPGFGVRPAQNNSEAERARVGRDYIAAMMRRYNGDPAKALAAYNGGPGRVDDAIAAHGAGWLSAMPAESRKYAMNGLSKLGAQAFNPQTGEVAELPVPEQVELDTETAEDYARRVLGDDIFDAAPDAEAAPASLEVEAVAARAEEALETGTMPARNALRISPTNGKTAQEYYDSDPEFYNKRALDGGYDSIDLVAEDGTVTPARKSQPAPVEQATPKVSAAPSKLSDDMVGKITSAIYDAISVEGGTKVALLPDEIEALQGAGIQVNAGIISDDDVALLDEERGRRIAANKVTAGQAIPQSEFFQGNQPRLQGTGQKPKRRGGGLGTFLEYITDIGGVRDDEGNSLSKMRGMQQGIAGAGSLIRKNGLSIDEIGERAFEDGWFPTRPTTSQVLDLIEQAQIGKVYNPLESVERAEEDAKTEQDAFAERVQGIAADFGVTLNEDELRHAATKVKNGSTAEDAVMSAVEWGAARDLPAILAASGDQDYDIPFDGESVTDEQAREIDKSLSQGSVRPETAARTAPEREASPQEPSGDSQPEITDSASGKGVIVRGASEAQLEAIKAALPEKASGMVNKDGAVTYSKKHEDKIRAALASTSLKEAERPQLIIQPLRGGPPTILDLPADATKTPAKATGPKDLGTNARGKKLYEDERGVRSYVDGGVRLTETVGLGAPGSGEISIDRSRRGRDYLTAEEYAAANPTKPDFAGAVERDLSNEQVDAVAAIFDNAEKRAAAKRPDYEEAVRAIESGTEATAAALVRKMNISYNEAARLMEQMEENGVVGKLTAAGRKPTPDRSAAIIIDPAAGTVKTVPIGSEARVPVGWTQSVAGGMATRPDPKDGGIVDVAANGKWFVVANDDAIGTLEGFDRRSEAFGALYEAVRVREREEIDAPTIAKQPTKVREAMELGAAAKAAGLPRKVPTAPDSMRNTDFTNGWYKGWDQGTASPAGDTVSPEKPTGYGANNKAFTKDKAEAAREILRKAANRLNSAGFDPEVAQAGLTLMGYHIEAGARSFIDASKAVAQDLGLTPADLRNSLRSWYLSARMWMEDNDQDVRGMDDADAVKVDMARIDSWGAVKPEPTEATPAAVAPAQTEASPQLSDEIGQLLTAFTKAFMDGIAFKSITEARAYANTITGSIVDITQGPADLSAISTTMEGRFKAGTADAKMLDEVIEAAVIQAARAISIENRDDAPQAYQRLVGLYARQPKLTVRTSTSIEQQAYSTPAPLSYLASRLAGIGQTTTVYEPSAGNGALLIDAKPMYVTANELNPQRAAMLRRLFSGATVTEGDAITDNLAPKQFDVVIGNPPFGPLKDGAGNSVEFEVGGFTTKEIDHAIALKALEKMRDDGSAVLIVGGLNKLITDPKARADAYNGKAKREFYFKLYSQYNVVDHFTVDGSLYERQGAGWPVDLIVIKGRGKSSLPLPAVKAPRQYDSWNALSEVLENGRRQETTGPVRATDGGFTPERSGPATVDGTDTRSSGVRGDSQRDGSNTNGQRDGVRDGPVDREPASPSVGDASEQSAPVSDQRQRRADRNDSVKLTGEETGENARQVSYTPASGANPMGTLVPVNMQSAIDDALDALRGRVGDIDAYVGEKLGYGNNALFNAFGAEQIDAIALAIDNIENGAGFIIGDQTGIGKGRIVAAIIRYAIRQNRPPIFVTEKPTLYKDMFRDMEDIGMVDMLGREINAVMTNASQKIPLDEEGSRFLTSLAPAKQDVLLQKIAAEGLQATDVDVVMTTYSQMQTLKGEETNRMAVLRSLAAQGGVLILDESHNAGGTAGGFKKKEGDAPNRAEFVRELVASSHGVFYSSATYAKRPDVMDLYAATDMRLAVKDPKDLGEAIAKGGVPMQQVVAAMLARSGQYARRERSFDGINYNTPTIDVDMDLYAATADVLAAIQDFSETYVGDAKEALNEEIKEEAMAISRDGSVGGAGASSTNFTAVMHNVINQMLLAFSAESAADRAIEAIKNGEKPVITVANTLESMLVEYAEDVGVKNGEVIDITFSNVFKRYLERTRWVTIRKPFMKKGEKGERKRLTDAQLGPAGVAAFRDALDLITDSGLDALPASPVDYILSRVRDAGYTIGEITGRTVGLNYRNGKSYLMARPTSDKSVAGKIKAIAGFNNGKVDAMLLNRSGSTGLSLHASKTFKDQRKRRMIIAQAEGNIDTHMQMLGRVHRTGQTVLPEYDQIVINVPAAKRPAAVLAKKMASLNANTTASRDSALTSTETIDFMNVYGDQVVANIMMEEPDLHFRLAEPLKGKEDEESYSTEDAASKVTGRIPLLPVALQEELYQRIEEEYIALLEQKDAAGENALEAKTFELDAVTESSIEVIAPNPEGRGSPFGEAVTVETVDVKRLGKPYPSAEVAQKVASGAGMDVSGTPRETQLAVLAVNRPKHVADTRDWMEKGKAWHAEDLAKIKDLKARDRASDKWSDNITTFRDIRGLVGIGESVKLITENGSYYGVVTDLRRTGNTKNPLAPGSWKATFAVVDGARSLTFPFSQMMVGRGDTGGKVRLETVENLGQWPVIEAFDKMQSTSREKRTVVTGNILAGFNYVKGKGSIINYTTDTGDVRQGIIMPKDFDLAKHEAKQPIALASPEVVLAWLTEVREPLVGDSRNGNKISIFSNPYRNEFTVVAARSKAKGGEFFLNRGLIEALDTDFVSRSNGMVANTETSNASVVIQTLLSMGVKFEVSGGASQPVKDKAKELVERIEGSKPRFSIADGGLFDDPAQPEKTMTDKQRAELEARQKQGMARKGGQAGLMDQEGGLFAGERDQGSLFSRPANRLGGNPEGFGRRVVDEPVGFTRPAVRNLQAELNKLGIGDRVTLKVAGKILDNAYIRGMYFKNVIEIATSKNPNPFETLNHEVIHALKDLGLFKPAEWRALEQAARADKAMMSSIRTRYGREGLTESELVEEGVADMFGAWRAGTKAERGFIRDAFERIVALFRALRKAITGANAQDEARAIVQRNAKAVMQSIASGEIGSRRSPMERLRQNAAPRAMVAYHGTPHDFDIFSTDAMGTGEGNQAYGWGLYFTDTMAVAEHYRLQSSNDISVNGFRYTANGKYELGKTNAEERAVIFASTAIRTGEDLAGKALWLRARARDAEQNPTGLSYFQKEGGWDDAQTLREAADFLDDWADKRVEIFGRMFEVDIPEADEYILWDEPISAQPKAKEAIGAWMDSEREAGFRPESTIANTIEALEKLIKEDAAGADIIASWQRNMDKRSVSMALKENGIKGTKYRDRNSRGTISGVPTYNYVIYDDKDVAVREKYSLHRNLIGEGVTDKIIDRLDRWRTNLQDRMLPLLRAQQRVEAQSGVELDESANPYLAEELMSGKVGARLERLTDEMVSPLFNQMKAEGIDAEELETYLYARHAVERNARISSINAKFDEGTGSGMSDVEAGGILLMAEAEGKLPALERLAERVDEMLRFAVQTRVEAGLLSQEEADAWAETYDYYVPLRGFAEVEPEAGEAERPRAGSGINVRGPESKRAFGRTSKAADILAYSIMQAEEAIVRAGRNEVAQAFYQMVRANPDPEFWKTTTVRRTPVWNERSGTVSYRTTDQIDPQDADYTVSLKIDGQERRVTMNRENPKAVQLAVAMRNLDGQDLGAVMRVLSGVNRYLSFVNTGLNPEFVITNAFRDIQTAGINLAQFDRAGLISGTMKDYRKALVASVRGSFKNPAENNEWSNWYQEFLDNGGRVYFNRVDDMNELRKRIEKQMQASTGTLGVAKSTFNNIKEFIENANMGVENAIRLSAYKNARERGMSPAQAASLAKNLTVNFNRRGAWGVAMNSLYLFYNASVQGSARLLQASFAKGRGGNRVRMILGAAVAIGYGLDMLNMMLSDDDDDGESFYDKVSDFDKSRNLIIMLPGERGKHVKIPLPYGYNAFYALGRSASQISRGEDWKGATGMFLQTVVDAFNPIGGTDNLMNLVAPTIADPIVDLTRNRDFADRPIMPEQGTYAPDTPDSQKYWDSISPHYRVVTDTLNSMTGGDEVIGGAIDVSPETLQHLSGVVTGAAGTFFIDRIGGLVEKTVSGEEITANDLPLVRKVVGTKPGWYDKAAFYERMDQIENVVSDVKEYRTREEDDKADAFEDSNVDVLDMVKPMKAAKKEMRKLKKERGKIEMQRDIGDITAEDAAAEIAFLRDEEKLIIEEFNADYIATVAKPKRP